MKRPNKCDEVSFYRGGQLIWQTVNGINITPPPEIIQSASHVVWKQVMTQEEINKYYGKR